MIISVFTKCFLRSILLCGRQKKLLLWSKMPSGCEAFVRRKLLIVIGFKFLIKSVMILMTLREAILQKIPEFYEILIKRWPPPVLLFRVPKTSSARRHCRPESFCSSGKFLQLFKKLPKECSLNINWRVKRCGKFQESLESFRTVWKVSGQSGKF